MGAVEGAVGRKDLDVIGQAQAEGEMLMHLKRQAAAYQAVNTDKTVVPAIHLIYEVAQAATSDDGLYLYRTRPKGPPVPFGEPVRFDHKE